MLGFHDEVAIISIIVTSIKEFMQWFAPAELALTRRAPMLCFHDEVTVILMNPGGRSAGPFPGSISSSTE